MLHRQQYISPVGKLFIISDEESIVALFIESQKYFDCSLFDRCDDSSSLAIESAKAWLDVYFKGIDPGPLPPIRFEGTGFRKMIWNMLTEIPYGKTMTYGELSRKAAEKLNVKSMSAQAIGGAVGHNPISIIVPCHRVLGSGGSLTGYAGGLEAKEKLLQIEGAILI